MDYHIVSGSDLGDTVTVVADYLVPSGSNDATRTWKSVVAELRTAAGETGTSQVPWRTDFTLLDAGDIKEVQFTVEDDAHKTTVDRATFLDTYVGNYMTEYASEFAKRYRFYGLTRSI